MRSHSHSRIVWSNPALCLARSPRHNTASYTPQLFDGIFVLLGLSEKIYFFKDSGRSS